ncbi:hypothetical protein DB88DRAFT_423306, partial [Papiliotrema laurentii]
MVTYDLAQYSWNDTQSVTVVSSTAEVIAVFPLSFLLTGGCGNWSYVLETIGVLVQTESNAGVGGLIDGTGASISAPDQKLQAGVYRFARGPEYFRKNLPARAGDASSTRSDSKRSSVNQTRFRTALIARDFSCLVSETDYEDCTACHIIPQSRPDVYQAVLGISYPPPLFRPAAGLLLSDTLHHAFDRLELSFW